MPWPLLDPPPLQRPTWDALQAFVRAGGGLALFLGPNAVPDKFHLPGARNLMPGRLASQWRAPEGVFLAPRNLSHPILEPFRSMPTAVPWDGMPIFRHWWFDEVDEDALAVLRYGNDQTAIFQQDVGTGHVLTMTTPISEAHSDPDRLWNRLTAGIDEIWPFVVLIDRMFLYLVGQAESRINYEVGEDATLAVETQRSVTRYQLFTPQGDWQELTSSGKQLHIPFAQRPGTYRLKSGNQPPLGFSVNLPAAETNLRRLGPERLDAIFGPDGYRLATSREQIQRDIGEARIGSEFYPLLVILLTIVMGLEHVLSNRFYAARHSG